jgi:hypothetical protein
VQSRIGKGGLIGYEEVSRIRGSKCLLKADTRPTPKPAKKRPATNMGNLVAAVCKITPKLNTQQDAIKAKRRPIRSATGAAPSAPKNVPADKIETTSDVWPASMFLCPLESMKPVENSSCQYLGGIRKDA